ncbi:MAG: hypothetical protein SGI88_11755 [Candidatus Hydrogenedentes bacterium]|nr:hypothetical protein [Candidatus Hydrogenedentota bacterium]
MTSLRAPLVYAIHRALRLDRGLPVSVLGDPMSHGKHFHAIGCFESFDQPRDTVKSLARLQATAGPHITRTKQKM